MAVARPADKKSCLITLIRKNMKDNITTLLRGFINFLLTLYQRRSLIFEMAKRDISTNHIGSALGFIWTFINPIVMIFIFWLIFSLGFKVAPKNDVPFVVWLTAGMAIWNTFAESLNGSTGVILSNSHLVKKVVFPLSILPVVKLLSSFVTHLILLLILILMIFLFGMPFHVYWFQCLYYFGAMSVLVLGLSWISSSINIFARDTAQIVNVILQFGFWGTPIFWNIDMMPQKLHFIFKLNPMYYIVQGYRDSFIDFIPFWEHMQMTLYFWGVTFIVFALGAIIFLRLRPHFADAI